MQDIQKVRELGALQETGTVPMIEVTRKALPHLQERINSLLAFLLRGDQNPGITAFKYIKSKSKIIHERLKQFLKAQLMPAEPSFDPKQIEKGSAEYRENRPERIHSIDILRGIVILIMIFVNDAATVPDAPGIFLHVSPGSDGMTIADWVFPAFLFIVGLSQPFSIGWRINRGENLRGIWEHIFSRSVILLLIGFFMVNMYSISKTDGIIDHNRWIFLMLAGVMLFRIVFPRPYVWTAKLLKFARITGVLLLIVLAFTYSAKHETGFMQMRCQWWGIIGLIGWAYLLSGTLYLFLHRQPAAIIGSAALFYLVYFADKTGMFQSIGFIDNIVSIGPFLGTHSAICFCGAALGRIISDAEKNRVYRLRIQRAVILGAGFIFAGALLHSMKDIDAMFRISKLDSTPSWGLLSAGFTTWLWALVYSISDISKENRINRILEYAGRNALMAYIFSTLVLYAIILISDISQNDFYNTMANGMGIWRSVFFTAAIVLLTAVLEKFKIRLEL